MSDLRYMYTTRVTQSAGGAIIDENGRTLRPIGNLRINDGDSVWTDGKIVYGHVPVKPIVNLFYQRGGIPVCGLNGEYYGMIYKNGRFESMPGNVATLKMAGNWLYVQKNGVYSQKSLYFLDMLCTKSAVFTAEYTMDMPYHNKATPTSVYYGYQPYMPLYFQVTNFYLQHKLSSSTFGFYWLSDEQIVKDGVTYYPFGDRTNLVSNPHIMLKKNGAVIGEIQISDYQIAKEKAIELYLSYDEEGTEAGYDHYRYQEYLEYQGISFVFNSSDIFFHTSMTQVLHFRFTDDEGNWEMILFSLVSGFCSPHTVDTNMNTGKMCYSYYNIMFPNISYVYRVDSKGNTEVLQKNIQIRKLWKNGVWNGLNTPTFPNAENATVYPVDEEENDVFDIHYDDCILSTDLRKNITIKDYSGNTLASDISFNSFMQLVTYDTLPQTSYNFSHIVPSVNNNGIYYTRYQNLRDGSVTVRQVPLTGNWGFRSYGAYGFARDKEDWKIKFMSGGYSYLGRMSLYHLRNKELLILLQGEWVIKKTDERWEQVIPYVINMNLELLSSKKINDLKTLNELIDSRTNL